MSPSGTLVPSSPLSFRLTEQVSSSSSLTDHTRTRKTSSTSGGPRSLRSTRSRGSLHNPSSAGHIDADQAALEAIRQAASGTSTDGPLTAEAREQASDADLFGFVDRFRSLVNQVSREVDGGLEIVRGENAPGAQSSHHPVQMLTAEELQRLLRTDEFGQMQVSEDHVMVLGGYIRRMPTIESLGSRERASLTSSGHRNGTHISSNQSRPSTRANTSVCEADPPPSRNSSSGISSVATGGHTGGGLPVSYHGPQGVNGERGLLENPDRLFESPVDVGPPTIVGGSQFGIK